MSQSVRRSAVANACGASSGAKWPASGAAVTVTLAKYAASRSPHARGTSGSCSGQRTCVGCAMRSARSARLVATVPDPPRYQPSDAVSAPGSA